jgi:NAD dependent epimerase/dehydratase family enzyme
MVRWAINDNAVQGALNLCAPAPVTNAEFTRALGRAMRRPAMVPAPAFALRMLLGQEMADSLLLGGQRAIPEKAQQLGYRFRFTQIDAALSDVFGP